MFTNEGMEVVLAQENALTFPSFQSADALMLGIITSKLALEYDREVAIQITRETDGLVLFQYMMDSKAERNLRFMEAKRAVVVATGHCSLWAAIEQDLHHSLPELFAPNSGYAPVGGAFPIKVNGTRIATYAVSGLHEGKDHELLIRSLCAMLKMEVPKFPGVMI